VFAGMIGVTMFGIFLTPVFYVLLRAVTGNKPLKQHGESTRTTVSPDEEAVSTSERPATERAPAGVYA
jgi:multidrug efflux pump